jgi:hypothetical protein
MHTFTKTPDLDNRFDHTEVTIRTRTENLHEVVEAFEGYLRAAGFHFDGHLDLVDDDGEPLPRRSDGELESQIERPIPGESDEHVCTCGRAEGYGIAP